MTTGRTNKKQQAATKSSSPSAEIGLAGVGGKGGKGGSGGPAHPSPPPQQQQQQQQPLAFTDQNARPQPSSSSVLLSIDAHPLTANNFLVVRYRDGSHRLAKIIETSAKVPKGGSSDTKEYAYYVHYVDFNRRMDEWIQPDRIIMLPSEANVLELAKQNGHSNIQGNLVGKRLLQVAAEDTAFSMTKKSAATGSNQSLHSLSGQSAAGGSGGRRRGAHHATAMSCDGDDDKNINNNDDGNDDGNDGGNDDDDGDDAGGDDKDRQSSASSGADDDDVAQPTTVAELEHDEHEGLDEKSLLEHEEITKVKNIANVLFGRHVMECWYFSPFPKEFTSHGPVDCLYFCEFTFRFFRTKQELVRFQSRPHLPRHPPGNEIYRDTNVSMFELDGAVEKAYCQNLCYFAKLFLDHKTLYWDVDPFLFYVLCSKDERGYHPVGFFSKEK